MSASTTTAIGILRIADAATTTVTSAATPSTTLNPFVPTIAATAAGQKRKAHP